MKKRDIEFNAADLVGSVESLADHLTGKRKQTLRTKTVTLPPRVKPSKPGQIRAIREKPNVSQPVLAAMMNIPTVTAASWEKGRRKPTDAALRLLEIARPKPEVQFAAPAPTTRRFRQPPLKD
jgi:putative transcriptional regulator